MKRIISAFAVSMCFSVGVEASTIQSGGFGIDATVYSFEGLPLTSSFSTPVTLYGHQFDVEGGVLRYDSNEDCMSGYCLGTNIPSAYMYINFSSAINRVGIYLGGTINPYQQGITIYDINGVAIESWNEATEQIDNNHYFIGLESLATDIHSIRLSLNYGQFSSYVDNLTIEAVPIPPAIWLFGSGLLGLIAGARSRP